MKKSIKILIIIAAFIVIFACLTCFYVVREDQHACVVRFSKIVDIKSEAGIYLKMPFVDDIKVYPKNAQLYDITPADVILQDKKTMNVDSYVMWKISDPLRFFQTIGTIEEAEGESRRIGRASHSHAALIAARSGSRYCYEASGSGIAFGGMDSWKDIEFKDDLTGSAEYKRYIASVIFEEAR